MKESAKIVGSSIQKTLTYLDKKGWGHTIVNAPKLLARLLFYQTESTWFNLGITSNFKPNSPEKTLTFKLQSATDSSLPNWIDANKEEFPWIYHPKEIETAFSEHHPYLTILDGENTIGFIKLGLNRVYIHDFDQAIRFPPGVGFVYDSLVLPGYRGRRILHHALSYAAFKLKSAGLRMVWAHIADYNQASLKAFRRMNFKPRATIRYVRLHRSWVFIRDGRYPFRNLEALIEEMSRT